MGLSREGRNGTRIHSFAHVIKGSHRLLVFKICVSPLDFTGVNKQDRQDNMAPCVNKSTYLNTSFPCKYSAGRQQVQGELFPDFRASHSNISSLPSGVNSGMEICLDQNRFSCVNLDGTIVHINLISAFGETISAGPES